jgi:hypothetical protein
VLTSREKASSRRAHSTQITLRHRASHQVLPSRPHVSDGAVMLGRAAALETRSSRMMTCGVWLEELTD